MQPIQAAVQTVLQKYAQFQGRAGRPEFWYWVLATFLVSVLLNIVESVIGTQGAIGGLFSLAILIPGLAVGARRLHDIGKSGWNLLWGLIPFLGWVYLIYLAVQPGDPGSNAYGAPEPLPMPGTA